MSDWEEPEVVAPASTGGASYGSRSGEYGGRGRGRGGSTGSSSGGCRKCGEEGHMSYNCPQNGGGGGNRSCFKCGEEGHMSRECPSGDGGGGGGGGGRSNACFKCGEEGHMSRDCPTGGGGGKSGGCYKCGEEGHMARDCPSAEDGDKPQRPKGCFNCGEEGHNKADCTNPSKPRDPADELGPDGKPRPPLYVPEHVKDEELFAEGVATGINFGAYDEIPVSVSGEGSVPPRLETFEDAGLRPLVLANIEKAGYRVPTPIQRYAVPTIMAGRDIMGCAQTGSGKTAAFLLPIINGLLESNETGGGMGSCAEPGAVIVAPTRELAIQIHNEGRKFALNSILRVVVCYGGASTSSQYRQLQSGCSILVATPGRLMDFLERGRVSFNNIKYVVLDEADRMLDMGFVSEIEKMMNHSSMPSLTERQTLLFSATFPEEIQTLAGKYLNNYVFYVVGTVGAANTDVLQEVVNVKRNKKRETLVNKLKDFINASADNKILVFVETKRTADFLASYLSTQDLNSTSIHGDRFQSQREEALSQFKMGIRNILVATAVAARGLDIKGVSHVINYDLPKEVDEYVHRIGRTGRVGNKGYALSFFEDENDGQIAKNLLKILKDANQEVPGWLEEAAAASGYSQTYHGVGDFASTDIRQGTEGSAAAFGGPQPADEEDW